MRIAAAVWMAERAFEDPEQGRDVIDEFGSRQRVAIGQFRVAPNGEPPGLYERGLPFG